MGSAGSKSKTASSSSSSSSSSSGRRRFRSKAHKVLQSSCLGTTTTTTTTSRSHSHLHLIQNQNEHQLLVSDNRNNKENASNARSPDEMPKIERYNNNSNNNNNRKVKIGQHSGEMPSNISRTASTIGTSSARAPSAQSLNPSGRFVSRFSFIPGNMSSRLSRADSLGSSRSYPTLFNNEDDVTGGPPVPGGFIGGDESHQGSELLPMPMINPTPVPCCEDSSANLQLNTTQSIVSNCSGDDRASSYVARNGINGSGIDGNLCSPRNLTEMENVGIRVPDRNAGAREPIGRNVHFSRTLSVGRLRDRVLRRSSLSDISFSPIQQQLGEVTDTDQVSVGQAWEDQTRTLASESGAVASPNSSAYPSSSMPNSLFSIQDYEVETSRSRETRYHDLLGHRSNFLERRRRIRSQVRALQRLGSRFENLSGHERTCILSGQHRTGLCTCRMSNQDPHLNDDTSARASISRIVMLAEALFEVLDEIHQQSMVLSSQPSVSSIGSVPAPSDVVESLPVKLYAKLQKQQNEEVAQCYICLVEYEEGERMRILPCRHEFHKTCVDKWLKEIHRVCPLCRGDICRSFSLPLD